MWNSNTGSQPLSAPNMEPAGSNNTKLGSLRELWCHFDQALTTQIVAPPQHVIEKIIIALEDARQWFESQASNSCQPTPETYDDSQEPLGINFPNHSLTDEVFSLIV